MQIALIAALTEQGVIGNQNKLPWHFPEELKYFRKVTLGKPVIMGRKTFESLGNRPLPDRKNIILSRDKNFSATDCIVVDSPEAAIKAVEKEREIMVIGGAQVYQQFLPLATRLYLTIIHQEYVGDAYFPTVNWNEWESIAEDPRDEYTIKIFDKKLPSKEKLMEKL
jgi:dihydrofolate reductase